MSLGETWDYSTSALIPEPGLQQDDDGFSPSVHLPLKDLDNIIFCLACLEMEKNTGTCKKCGCPVFRSSQEYTEAVIPVAPCIWPSHKSLLDNTEQQRSHLPQSVTFLPPAVALKTGRVGISSCFEKTQIPCDKDVQMIWPFRAVLGSPFHPYVTIMSLCAQCVGAACLE